MAVYIVAQNDRAQRPHQEPRAEGGEREHQRRKWIRAGKEGSADVRGIVAEDHKVVHLEEVPDRDAYYRTDCRIGREPWQALRPPWLPFFEKSANLTGADLLGGFELAILLRVHHLSIGLQHA